MFRVSQIETIAELLKLWPRLSRIAQEESKGLDVTLFLQRLLHCFSAGAVFVVRGDAGLMGSCMVGHGPGSTLILHGIPNDKGTGIAKACLAAVKVWAKANEYDTIQATTRKLSGSSYRYFEKTLGFRRNSVTFKLIL
jgi:hypothetical protein